MYLHIGKNVVVNNNEIIGIFDVSSMTKSKEFKLIYEKLKEENNILDVSDNHKKSIIITKEKEVLKGYISNISSITLAKRVDLNVL
ncbi:MAG: extracellular matrix regulator RemB [Clostridia bacterium]